MLTFSLESYWKTFSDQPLAENIIMIPKKSADCNFFREILKLIKGTKNKDDQDIEAGDDSFKKQFTKEWVRNRVRWACVSESGSEVRAISMSKSEGVSESLPKANNSKYPRSPMS